MSKDQTSDVPQDDTLLGQLSGLKNSQESGDDPATDPADGTETASETGDFNPSEYEQSFGLPAGSLKDVSSADEALQAIREYTDKTLSAGLGFNPGTATEPPADAPDSGKTEPKKSGNEELDALRAELTQVKSVLEQQNKQQMERVMSELDRRIVAEIDSWGSSKYGTSQSRNFSQMKALNEIRELAETHYNGYLASGRPLPVIEAGLRQVRAFHDETFVPGQAANKSAKGDRVVLGTPSGSSARTTDNAPKNIHEALQQNFN